MSDPFALGGFSRDDDDLTPAERRLVDGLRRLMPNYRYDLSYFVKERPAAEPDVEGHHDDRGAHRPDASLRVTAADLWAEHQQIVATVHAMVDAGLSCDTPAVDAMTDRELEIEDQLVAMVATDKASLIAQVHLLVFHLRDFEWGDYSEGICRKLIAGIAIAPFAVGAAPIEQPVTDTGDAA